MGIDVPTFSRLALVDIDRWAVLLEQLMEVPEEGAPAERKGGKRE